MAVVEDRIVRPVSLFELVETLSDEEAADAVASHEGKRRLEKVQATERGELVEHQQQAVAPSLGGKVLGQAPPDRSEERRVGKECVIRVDLGGRRIIKKKKQHTKSHIKYYDL